MVGLVMWGVLHIVGGASLLVAETVEGLEMLGRDANGSVPIDPGEATAGLLRFHSLNVLFGGLAVLGLAIAWWRQRRPWQLDVALGIAVALDVGLIAFLVVPGTLAASEGLLGPTLVLVAAAGAFKARASQQVRGAQ